MKIEFDNEPFETAVCIYYTRDERLHAEMLMDRLSNHHDVLSCLVQNKKIQLKEVNEIPWRR